MATRAYGASLATYNTWADKTEYVLTNRVEPTIYNGQCYECTTAGTSGEDEPTWIVEPLGATVNDGTVVWACRDYEESPAALSVTLDTGGRGGHPYYKDIWVKSDGDVKFQIDVSHTGLDGTWREFEGIQVNNKDKFKQYVTAYRFMRVSTETVATNEIEIVAGV